MDTIIDYWFVVFALACVLSLCVYAICFFMKEPKSKKVENVKEWLRFAVTEAEKQLGSGTGSIKLRYVYDMCVSKFPWVTRLVTFVTFSQWVDDALVWMKEQIDKNQNIASYIEENHEN